MNRLGLAIIFIIVIFTGIVIISLFRGNPYIEEDKIQLSAFLNLYMKYMSSKLSLSKEDRDQISKIIFSDFNQEIKNMSNDYGNVDFTKIKDLDENKLADCLNIRVILFTTFYVPKKKCANVFNLIKLIQDTVKNPYDKTKGNYIEVVQSFIPIFAEYCGKTDDKK